MGVLTQGDIMVMMGPLSIIKKNCGLLIPKNTSIAIGTPIKGTTQIGAELYAKHFNRTAVIEFICLPATWG